jgi:hypothetical protein
MIVVHIFVRSCANLTSNKHLRLQSFRLSSSLPTLFFPDYLALSMKSALAFAALLFVTSVAHADTEVPRDKAGSIKSVDAQEIEEQGPKLVDQIIKLKFNYRSTEISEGKAAEGVLGGSVSIFRPNHYVGKTTRAGSARVTFPADRRDWFLKIPTDFQSRASITVYAKVQKGEVSGYQAEILGRELKTDAKGSRIVWDR